jgi:hypothetical protein
MLWKWVSCLFKRRDPVGKAPRPRGSARPAVQPWWRTLCGPRSVPGAPGSSELVCLGFFTPRLSVAPVPWWIHLEHVSGRTRTESHEAMAPGGLAGQVQGIPPPMPHTHNPRRLTSAFPGVTAAKMVWCAASSPGLG